ncbi:MAG: 2-hydroxyacyl-CoA dehydratase family protein [Candidatus Bathyarchaeota archaeon]|nr:2-hydroxyacyl-CoA dehydratase family protein [Candidatus Bathyarchaeota archaeon]
MAAAKPERRLQTTRGFYRNYVKKFYEDAHKAKAEGKPVAWVASTFPIETLLAMNVFPVWPENYASLCAARQVSVRLCEIAESKGFSKDLCSYARCVIGSLFEKEEDLPEGGMPKPDFLVASTGACDTHFKWFQFVSRHFKVPLFLLDVPYNISGADSEHLEKVHVESYVSRLEDLIEFLEKQTGTKLDKDRLRETTALSDHTSQLWMEVQDYRKTIPTPMDARDAFSAVFFMLSIPGTQMAVDFYEKLRDEVKERTENRFGIIENEKYRLVWDNLPLWFDLKFFEYLNSLGAVVVAETFSHVWMGRLDPSKPLESLAKKYLPNFANCGIGRKIDLIENLVKDFRADGVILPTNWGCRMMSIGETIVKETIYKRLGVPSLIIDVDSSDWRSYNETQVKTNVEVFLQILSEKKQIG